MKRQHPKARELDRYLLQDPAIAADEAIRLHVAGCEICRQELERRRSLVAALEAMPEERPSAGFADRVLQAAYGSAPGEAGAAKPPRRLISPEFVNMGIALAVTYLFVHFALFRGIAVLGAAMSSDGADRLLELLRESLRAL
ncbi:MAG: hypothetical protein J7639_05310 [Paenibacillaceae bacterium]|nr:hypothetical protein [Paenibacillaceae bacterium]